MFFIGRFFDRRKVWKLLPDYPVYTPPHKGGWEKKDWMTKEQAQENYEFFLAEKDKRIGYLAAFMAEFGAKVELTDEGLVAVSQWMYRYGAYLEDTKQYRRKSVRAFATNNLLWTGDIAGLNIIFDVSTFCGECIVHYNEGARWMLFTGKSTKRNHETRGFNKPWVVGSNLWPGNGIPTYDVYPPSYIHELVQDRWGMICGGDTGPSCWHDPLSLARHIRYHAGNDPERLHPEWPLGFSGPHCAFGKIPPPPDQIEALKRLDQVSRLKRLDEEQNYIQQE
jgi:hypothetical protein